MSDVISDRVISADGTSVVFDRLGAGPPVIVVGGAMCDRSVTRPLAERMAEHFTVVDYDRRGRGDSGDTMPYAVAREVEDLDALIAQVGGSAAIYGHSSGAALALHAASAGLPVSRLVLHEPPFAADETRRRESREFAEGVRALLAQGRHGDAVASHLTGTGMPPELVDRMRAEPWWARAEASAPTLSYDYEILDQGGEDGMTPVDLARRVTVPTLVLCGGTSPAWMIDMGRRIAGAVPDGRFMLLEDHGHVVPPETLVPLIEDFLTW
ncbi:alpha/beta hydrolase [Streptosporangium sp. NPDC048865]|uniref:alpha/beta fold hydrolase n=1 Tax=Streptosporangium sp. NPDC048865 TaxID=3155766 RepID=UPI00342A24CE